MADLKRQLDALRAALEALPESATASQIAQLENEARNLLAQSKNTIHESDARELFGELARRSAPASPENAQVRALLRRARIRIEIAGDEDDIDEAIDILAEALEQAPDNPETLSLLHEAASRSPHLDLKVRGLLERYGLETPAPSPEPPPARPAPLPEEDRRRAAVPGPAASTDGDLISETAQAYYSGDYQRTVDLANRVLADDPDNAQAQEYRQKAEDNLLRGVVPDHRIPFDARVAYNRANSLVRAGNYDEAERLYREARDLAARAGIQSWKDVEQALLDIQDLSLARELLAEGDRLLAADDWDGALQKYEGALRVVSNDPLAQERIDLVRNVRQQYDQATVQLNMASGSLQDRARDLQELHTTLANLRQLLPGSERLKRLVREVEDRRSNLIAQLRSQAMGALTRVESASVLEEKHRLTIEAVRALDRAVSYSEGVLAYGRAQEPPPARRRLHLRPLVDEVHSLLGLDEVSRVEFVNAVEPGFEVDADPEQLFRVLSNLARNAVQAMAGNGSGVLVRRLTIGAEREGGVTRILVEDTGPGLPQKARDNLFAAFRGSARSGGTGLGLAIAHELVRAHGGTLELVESRGGRTVFAISIPDRPIDLAQARDTLRRPA